LRAAFFLPASGHFLHNARQDATTAVPSKVCRSIRDIGLHHGSSTRILRPCDLVFLCDLPTSGALFDHLRPVDAPGFPSYLSSGPCRADAGELAIDQMARTFPPRQAIRTHSRASASAQELGAQPQPSRLAPRACFLQVSDQLLLDDEAQTGCHLPTLICVAHQGSTDPHHASAMKNIGRSFLEAAGMPIHNSRSASLAPRGPDAEGMIQLADGSQGLT